MYFLQVFPKDADEQTFLAMLVVGIPFVFLLAVVYFLSNRKQIIADWRKKKAAKMSSTDDPNREPSKRYPLPPITRQWPEDPHAPKI